MTIIYTTRGIFAFFRLLFRWHGSLWKSLYGKFMLFIVLYAVISAIYRNALKPHQQDDFDDVVNYFHEALKLIPLQFLLGFYVALVVGRWWEVFNLITWTDRMMLFVGAYVQGSDPQIGQIRRTLGRYANLTCLMVWRELSMRVKKRFPSMDHVCRAGLMTKAEKEAFEATDNPINFMTPLLWMTTLIYRAQEVGVIDSVKANQLVIEVALIRDQMSGITGYDWVKIPLIYTQMTTFAVYGYFIFATIGKQYTREYKPDLYVPIQTILEFMFYMGWLQVAEDIFDPFGEDEEDFEMNVIFETNVACASKMASYDHGAAVYVGSDVEWSKLPHTRASKKIKDHPFYGHLVGVRLRDKDAEFVDLSRKSMAELQGVEQSRDPSTPRQSADSRPGQSGGSIPPTVITLSGDQLNGRYDNPDFIPDSDYDPPPYQRRSGQYN